MKKLIPFIIVLVLASCSDADIVSGTYEGTFYGDDTVTATMKITRVEDEIIRMDVTNSLNQSFTEFGTLFKNSNQDYSIMHGDPIGVEYVDGSYQNGFITIHTTFHDYTFEGNRK